MLRNRTARWTVATLALCALTLVAVWFALIAPRRSEAASLQAQNAEVKQSNDQLQIRIAELQAQFAQLPTTKAKLAAIRKQLPTETAMPALVRDLNAMADATGVTLMALTPSPGSVLEASASAASGSAASSPAAPSPAASSSAAPSPAASGSAASGSGALGDSRTVVSVPLTITVEGDYFQVVAFLEKVQARLPRAVLVNGLQVGSAAAGASSSSSSSPSPSPTGSSTGATGGRVHATITGSIFVMPQASSASGGTS